METASTEHPFYGTKQTKKIVTVTNNAHMFTASKGINAGKPMYQHTVLFEEGYFGSFYQLTPVLTENKEEVKNGDTICFIPSEYKNRKTGLPDLSIGDILTFCYEETVSTDKEPGANHKSNSLSGQAIVFALSYSKDIVIEAYKNRKDVDIEEYASAIKKLSIDLKNHLINNI